VPAELVEFASKLDLAERQLLQLIASGEIGPGEPIRQSHLAERMGISPTPVREALRRLEAQGVVVLEPHRGVRVAEVEPHDMSEIYEIRAALEGLAVECAVDRMSQKQVQSVKNAQARLEEAWAAREPKLLVKFNYQFHTGIYRLSGRPRLIKLIDSLWPLFPWDSMWTIPGRGPAIVKEHQDILDAIRDRDAARAHQAMRIHMEAGAKALLAYRDAQPVGAGGEQATPGSRRDAMQARKAPARSAARQRRAPTADSSAAGVRSAKRRP
jgi:DNA-binding GntR family transcriptional regulator